MLSLLCWVGWAVVNHGLFIGKGNDVTLLVPAAVVLVWLAYALSVGRKGVLA